MNIQTPALLRSPHLRGPFLLWPRASDLLLAVTVFILMPLFSVVDEQQPFYGYAINDLPFSAFVLFALSAAPLYWRRRFPLAVMGVTLVWSAVFMLVGYSHCPQVAVMFALYSVGRYGGGDLDRYTSAYIGVSLLFVGVTCSHHAVMKHGGLFNIEELTAILFPFLIWYVGTRIRVRGDYLRLLQERAAQLEREQLHEARRAVAEERARIAREMHDIVAHQVSVMTVQAGAAKTVASSDPQRASQAMETVERAGRQALNELRQLIGILRPSGESDGLYPQPGVEDIARLVEHLARTGLDVTYTRAGERESLPIGIGLCAYRIVQEALTNVLKHAGPGAHVDVRLTFNLRDIDIEVVDDGCGTTILPGSGHGIAGMRERAQMLGGEFDAGPCTGRGFRVWARIPIGTETA